MSSQNSQFSASRPVLIGLGANLPSRHGWPRCTLLAAIQSLEQQGLSVQKISPFYTSAPVPDDGSPWYVNGVISVHTKRPPEDLLQLLLAVEADFGRQRGRRNAPRILDLDLLAYGDLVLDQPGLSVPHPRLHMRAFTLMPIRDIHRSWVHPVGGKTVSEMIAALPADQCCRRMTDEEEISHVT